MSAEISDLVDNYAKWLRDKTTIRTIKDWTAIETPFLDRHNDHIEIYVKPEEAGFLLTDDGYTLTDLEHSGCSLNSPKRQALLRSTLNGFGVNLVDSRIETRAGRDTFAVKKHDLIQAILSVNDLFYLAESTVASIFHEDVVSWLDANRVRYTQNLNITGKTGYNHRFDFIVPKSDKAPERILQAVNNPSKDKAESILFAWVDTQKVRAPDVEFFALLNDRERRIPEGVPAAFENWGIPAFTWTERESLLLRLAS